MKKSVKISLTTAGSISILLALMHYGFWEIFKWKETLECLNGDNRGIFQILNICMPILVFGTGYISIFKKEELINTSIGRTLLLFIILFYIARTISGFMFFDMDINDPRAIPTVVVLFLVTGLYIFAAIKGKADKI